MKQISTNFKPAKSKLFKITLLVVLFTFNPSAGDKLFSLVNLEAQTYTLTDADVVVSDGVIQSCSYDFAIKDIIIPETLDGQTVTGIRDGVFFNNNLTSVTIPNSVTFIGVYAFANNSLTNVTFEPNSYIRLIGYSAFADNSDLTSITLPSNANTGFSGYKIGNSISYSAGDNISNFNTAYYAVLPPHTLTLDEVEFADGTITDYVSDYRDIIIPPSFSVNGTDIPVTTIGDEAFMFNQLTNVIIPNGVTTIGSSAFTHSYMTSISIPNSVSTIGDEAFSNNSLTSVTIPNSIASIGDDVFRYNDLTSVTIPNGITVIGNGMFSSNNLTNVTIPNSVTTIGYSAFSSNSLTSVTIPSSVTTIGNGVFSNNSLTSIVIPNNVTSIGGYAFSSNSLTSVTLPSNLTSIGYAAFSSNSLTSVTFEQNSYIRLIEDYAFGSNPDLTAITLPTNANIDFSGYKDGNGNSLVASDNITVFNTIYYASLPSHTLTIDDVKFAEGEIRDYFGGYVDIIVPVSFNIDGNDIYVSTIGERAFSASHLTEVAFEQNSNIRLIKSDAFTSNSNLTSITLPTNANSEFTGYKDRENNGYAAGDNITDFSSYFFIVPCVLTLPDVTFDVASGTITDYPTSFHDIIIPTSFNIDGEDISVTSIGANAFSYNYLTNVTIPNSVTSIEDGAFRRNDLTNVTIPNSVTNIGASAFSSNSLTSVTIPNRVTIIRDDTFYGNSLTSVTIPNSITSIGDWAFSGNKLTSITIPNSVTSIKSKAFISNNLINVTFEENSKIRFIESAAFSNNAGLTSILLPSNTNSGFSGYKDENGNSYNAGDNITNFWTSYHPVISAYTLSINDVSFDAANGTITDYTADYFNIIIPASFNVDEKDISVTSIGEDAFKSCNLIGVSISSGVTSIGYWAFSFNDLTSISIPNSVTSIGGGAFAHNDLTSITIPSSITSIGGSTFSYNDLTSVTIPNSVTSIEGGAFSYNDLTSVTIPNNVISIGMAAFNNNAISKINGKVSKGIIYARNNNGTDDKTTIVSYGGVANNINFIPNSVTSIGDESFQYVNLTGVTIPNGVTSIGKDAFRACNLTNVTISNSVTSIGRSAFNQNAISQINGEASKGIVYARNNLGTDDSTTIVSYGGVADNIDFIPNTVTSIGEYAFYGNSITDIIIPNSVTSIGHSAFDLNGLTSVALPYPVIKEGYTFTRWSSSYWWQGVTAITSFNSNYSYEAQFNLSGFMVSGNIIPNNTQPSAISNTQNAMINNMEDVILYISGDFTGTRPVNADGSYSFALNAGRNIVITPVKDGYTFTPPSITVNNIQGDVANQDFAPVVTAIDNPAASEVGVYPNPVSKLLTIETNGEYSSITILDMAGKVRKMVDCQGQTDVQIDMGQFVSGIYIIKLQGMEGTVVRKVVKR